MIGCDLARLLQRLLKYPPVEDIYSIISLAFQTKDALHTKVDLGVLSEPTATRPSKLPSQIVTLFGRPKKKRAKAHAMKMHSTVQWKQFEEKADQSLEQCVKLTKEAINVVEAMIAAQTVDRPLLETTLSQLGQVKLSLAKRFAN